MKLEQLTVRIYDSSLSKKVENLFKNCKDIYSTKNPFLVDCIMRGAEAIEKDLLGAKKIESITELFDELHLTIEKLDKLSKLVEKNSKEIMANLSVNQKLLASSYNMLIGLSDDCPLKKEFVEAGMFEDIPERLVKFLEDLLKVYLKWRQVFLMSISLLVMLIV